MTVTLNEMATAYITSVENQLVSAKEQLAQAEQYVKQLEEHLDECKLVNSQGTQQVLGNGAGQTSVSAPASIDNNVSENPFVTTN